MTSMLFSNNNKLTMLMDDHYMISGVCSIFESFLLSLNERRREYVVFSCDYYYEARELAATQSDVIFIMMYSFNDYDFIGDDFIHFKLHNKIKPVQFIESLNNIVKNRVPGVREYPINIGDLFFMYLMMAGESMSAISSYLNVNVKRIYRMRLLVFKKIGCHNSVSFNRLCKSKTFSIWFNNSFPYLTNATHDRDEI